VQSMISPPVLPTSSGDRVGVVPGGKGGGASAHVRPLMELTLVMTALTHCWYSWLQVGLLKNWVRVLAVPLQATIWSTPPGLAQLSSRLRITCGDTSHSSVTTGRGGVTLIGKRTHCGRGGCSMRERPEVILRLEG